MMFSSSYGRQSVSIWSCRWKMWSCFILLLCTEQFRKSTYVAFIELRHMTLLFLNTVYLTAVWSSYVLCYITTDTSSLDSCLMLISLFDSPVPSTRFHNSMFGLAERPSLKPRMIQCTTASTRPGTKIPTYQRYISLNSCKKKSLEFEIVCRI